MFSLCYDPKKAIAREFAAKRVNGKAAETACSCTCAAPVEEANLMLFTATTCPNCRIAKTFLDKANLKYEVIVAENEPMMAQAFDIRQAPTLVIQRGNDIEKLTNLSEIRRYIDSL